MMKVPMPCSLRSLLRTLSVVQVLIVSGLATPALAGDASLAPFSGQWARIVDEVADEARLESIGTATGDLSWIVRKMATGVLEKTTSPPRELAFVWDGEALRQRVRGPNGEYDRPVDPGAGPTRQTDPRGEETTIEWRRTTEGLEVHWQQSQAFGRNLYRVDEVSQTLHVEHRIQVTAIDGIDEIVYGARFGRMTLPPVSAAPPAQPVSGDGVDVR